MLLFDFVYHHILKCCLQSVIEFLISKKNSLILFFINDRSIVVSLVLDWHVIVVDVFGRFSSRFVFRMAMNVFMNVKVGKQRQHHDHVNGQQPLSPHRKFAWPYYTLYCVGKCNHELKLLIEKKNTILIYNLKKINLSKKFTNWNEVMYFFHHSLFFMLGKADKP